MTTVIAFSLGAVAGSWGCLLVGRWAERRRIRRVNAAFEARLAGANNQFIDCRFERDR